MSTSTIKLLRPALYLLALAFFTNASVSLYTHLTGRSPDLSFDPSAFAQSPAPLLGARGLYMTPAQLTPSVFGFYIFDVDSSTVSMYSVAPNANKLKFVAARSFKHDRFLEDYNTEGLSPKEVETLVNKQRNRTELKNQTDTPTVEQPTTEPADK